MGRIGGFSFREWLAPSSDFAPGVSLFLRNGALLRWCVLLLVAVRVITDPPRLGAPAIVWLLLAALCNAVLPWFGERLGPSGAARVAQAAVLIDAGALVALVQIIFVGNPPDVLYGAVALVLLEAVICWGVPGVVIIAGLTLTALSVLEAVRCGLLHACVSWNDIASDDVMIGFLSGGLVMARRLFANGPSSPAADPRLPAPTIRFTSREREVLTLIAEGCSNTMIARRLHLTESTVKGHVESILNRLNVPNRTGAVAVASRLGLLDGAGSPTRRV